MSVTKHYNLTEMPVGAIEWVAIFNTAMNKIEEGRTVKVNAAVNLVKKNCFYIGSDGKAYKSGLSTNVDGIWYSADTTATADGFGQIEGIMSDSTSPWNWNEGVFLYHDLNGALTEIPQPNLRPIAWTLSATEIILLQPKRSPEPYIPADSTATDATNTVLASVTLSEGKSYLVEAKVSAKQGDTNRAGYVRRAVVYRPVAGSATLLGSVQDSFTVESSSGWDCTIDVSGNLVRVLGSNTGVGVTVAWRTQLELLEI